MHVIPSDQTSTRPSYWPSSIARITSGAIQWGVPTNELAGDIIDAEPKSAAPAKNDAFDQRKPNDDTHINNNYTQDYFYSAIVYGTKQ